MFKLYDFSCLNKECDDYQKVMEVMVDNDDPATCQGCLGPMEKVLSFSQGVVRQGTPRFHRNSKPK